MHRDEVGVSDEQDEVAAADDVAPTDRGVDNDLAADAVVNPAADVADDSVEAPRVSTSKAVESSAGAEIDEMLDTDADDRETATVGATAGSARAAARQSGVTRAGSTAAKSVATRSRSQTVEDRGSMFARLGRFFREVVAELRKVIWPARNQMITYTIVVIVFVVFMVALVAGLDLLFAKGVLTIFG